MLREEKYGDVLCLRLANTFPNGRPIAWTGSFFVDGLLIDTGCSHTAKELAEFFRKRPLKTIVNTHYHEDHIGGNAILQRMYKVDIFASPLTLEKMYEPPKLLKYQEITWGYPDLSFKARKLGKHIEIENYRFEVVKTPGHSLDHISLFESNTKWIFVADAFIHKNPVVARMEEDQNLIIESLKKIRALDPEVMFTGTGKVVRNALEVLDDTIRYLEDLRKRILELYNKGLTISEICRNIWPEKPLYAKMVEPFTGGTFSTENLVKTFLKSHLKNEM